MPTPTPVPTPPASSLTVPFAVTVTDFNAVNLTAIGCAVAAATGVNTNCEDDVNVSQVEYIVAFEVTGLDAGATTANVKPAVASANSVTAARVVVTESRRLAEQFLEARRLAGSFSVEITHDTAAAAQATMSNAADSSTLSTALEAENVNASAMAAPTPTGNIKVTAKVAQKNQ